MTAPFDLSNLADFPVVRALLAQLESAGPRQRGQRGSRPPGAGERPLSLSPGPNPMAHGGVLLNLKQIHDRPEDSPRERQRAMRSQQRVLDELMAAEPRTVFTEEYSGVVLPAQLSHESREMVQQAFAGYVAGQDLTPAQKDCFAVLDASLIYAHLYADIELRGTASAADGEALDQYVEANLSRMRRHGFNDEDRALLFEGREKHAASIVAEWRKDHPDELAALVYGAAHDYTPYEEAMKSRLHVVDATRPALAPYTSDDFLDDLIMSNPDHVAARLERGSLADVNYVLKRHPRNAQAFHMLAQLASKAVAAASATTRATHATHVMDPESGMFMNISINFRSG